MKKRAVVDVDGTLVDLHRPLHAMLHRLYPDMPDHFGATKDWNWYREWITDDQFYAVVDVLHDNQWREPPLPGAQELFRILNERQFEVVVASHRRQQTAQSLAQWLNENDLYPYSGVFTNHDKTFLIKPGGVLIDDAPKTILYADRMQPEVSTYYLAWPWNEDLPGRRFTDLYQLSEAINNG